MEIILQEARAMVERKNTGVRFIKMDENRAIFEVDARQGRNDSEYRLLAVDLGELEYGLEIIYETTVNVESDDYSSDVEMNMSVYDGYMKLKTFESKSLKEYKRESSAIKFAEKYAKENNFAYVGVFYS